MSRYEMQKFQRRPDGSYGTYLTVEDAVWSRVAKGAPDDCWPWTGKPTAAGYGRVLFQGAAYLAHRVTFLSAGGVLTEEKPFALHTCDNPPCCNPAHLYAGDHLQNMRDRTERGRHGAWTKPEAHVRGSAHAHAKLTEEDVRAICRDRHLFAHEELATRHGVSRRVVGNILAGKGWQHVAADRAPAGAAAWVPGFVCRFGVPVGRVAGGKLERFPPLGTLADAKMAKACDTTPKVVRERREACGIPPRFAHGDRVSALVDRRKLR